MKKDEEVMEVGKGGVAEKAKVKGKGKVSVKGKGKGKGKGEVEAKVEPEVEDKVENKVEDKVEDKVENKDKGKGKVKAKTEVEAKVEAEIEPEVEAKVEAKEEAKEEAEEEWRDIKDFKNYKVSSHGRIKNIITNKMHTFNLKHGYHYAKLKNDNGFKCILVHKLVAEAFFVNDDPINKTVINHIHGERTDNNIKNLRYATAKEKS